MKLFALGAIASIAIATAAPASAQNLVTNGGFEQYTALNAENEPFAGWTQTANHLHSSIYVGASGANSANAAAFGSVGGAPDTLSQALSTAAGATYSFSFKVRNAVDGGDGLTASFGGQKVFDLATVKQGSLASYTAFSYSLVAASNLTTISFTGFDGPSHLFLDDVSVTLVSAASAAPEPATWGLMILGFGAAGVALRRSRKKVALAHA